MSGAFWSDHHHIDIVWRDDRFEVDAEAMRNAKNFSGMQIRLDGLLVKLALSLVRSQDVNPVRTLRRLVWRHNHHSVGTCLLGAGPIRVKANDNLVTAVAEILGLGVSLAAITEDCDRLVLQRLRTSVAFVENFDHQCAPYVV